MFNSKQLLNNIYINNNDSVKTILFNHADKMWLLPYNQIRPSFELYQPTSARGKIVKFLVPVLKSLPFILSKLGASTQMLDVSDEIKAYVMKIFKTDKFYIAGYMGDSTSLQNNKVTLQVFDADNILGYIKLTNEPIVITAFEREVGALNFLNDKGVTNIPKVLAYDEICGMQTFVQNTDKTIYEKVRLAFDERHLAFVSNIVNKTRENIAFEDSDLYRSIRGLKAHISVDFNDNNKCIVYKAIEKIEDKLGGRIQDYAFSHGDFTPWNIYYVENHINAFDFEYCAYKMPLFLDVFHYITQLVLLGLQGNGKQAYAYYESKRNLISEYVEDPDFIYLCYLIVIMEFYLERAVEPSPNNSASFAAWIKIIEKLISIN